MSPVRDTRICAVDISSTAGSQPIAGHPEIPSQLYVTPVPATSHVRNWPNLHGHLPVLDGVRGLAVLMVLVFHFIGTVPPNSSVEHTVVEVTKYGSYGVELFFVLSGFLITGILYDGREQRNYFRNFYIRRILRVFPLYYGVLVLVFCIAPLIPLLHGPTLTFLLRHQAWAWLYGINIYIAQQGDWSYSYLDHFWSLSIEEHFYCVWPFVVFMLARRPRILIAVCLGSAWCAIAGRLIGSCLGLGWVTTYTLTPFRLDGLALGAYLAVAGRQPGGLERFARVLPPVATLLAGLLAGSFVWTILVSRDEMAFILPIRAAFILCLLACLLVWALVAPDQSAISRAFRSRFMMCLGKYSYGLYVYHHFISYYLTDNRTDLKLAALIGSHGAAVLVQATLGMAMSFALAYLSYEAYEKRFLRLKRFFGTSMVPTAGTDAPRNAVQHA
jgi:peptidoglycan/LPS O-acetylase OafA/YrhL